MRLTAPGRKGPGTPKLKRTPTTVPGTVNERQQEVIGSTGAKSMRHRHQTIYRLLCRQCRREYGANGADVHLRCCPFCQGGTEGEPLPEKSEQAVLF